MTDGALRLIPSTEVATMADDSPTDYAAEVGKLVKAAQSPGAIGGGLALGGATGFAIYRLRNPKGTTKPSYTLSIVGGTFAAVITHSLISWAKYRGVSDSPSVSDGASGIDKLTALQNKMSQQSTEWDKELDERMKAAAHPISIGVGVGTLVAATYGLYKWRNPKGSKKQRWVLPVLGGIVASTMAQGVTASIIMKSQPTMQTKLSDMSLSDLFDFSSVTSGIVTAASIVCLYGGGRYLYDSWNVGPSRKARKA